MSSVGSESFPRQLRLIRAREFQQVFRKNKRFGDNHITILVGNQDGANPRIGFAIAKKQVAKAVDRNKLKRLVRESFRRQQHELPTKDMVILVRKEILKLDNAALLTVLDKQWTRIKSHAKNSDTAN